LPILPLIDLLILLSTGSLLVGFVLKTIALTTRYRPAIMGFTSLDFVIIAGVWLALALVLAARTWVKLNEPHLLGTRSQTGLLRRSTHRGAGTYEEPAPPEPVHADQR
jgi:hypothetical protein